MHKLPLLLLVQFALLGCRSSTQPSAPTPPAPAPVVNARLDKHVPLYSRTGKTGDACLLARCRSCDEFGKRTKGDWIHTWVVARFDVLNVEQGTWPETNLSFICYDAWPTPESGIMLKKALWPYRPDTTIRFWIDTTVQPPTIVDQQLINKASRPAP